MRWPWQKSETRSEGSGGYTDLILNAIAAETSRVADDSATAGVEAAAGALSRAFADADVDAPSWVQDSVTPFWLAQVGRSLVREGASLSAILMDPTGGVDLVPAAYWHFQDNGGELERDWLCYVTTNGPSSTRTRLLPRDQVVLVRWGTAPGTRYRGQGPISWANLTAKLHSQSERALGDEASGPVAHLLPVPEMGEQTDDDGEAVVPHAALRADIKKGKGRALLVETTRQGFGEGPQAAPTRDWAPNRLGPAPPQAFHQVAEAAFSRMLSACGTPPSLFLSNSDGTAQREALRRWHMGTVLPLAKTLEHELTAQFGTAVRLRFDRYPLDLAGRAQTFQKLVAGGVAVNEALATSGLLIDEN